MEIAAAIRTHLLEQAAIVALVEDRIVPVRYAQGLAYPLVVVQAFRAQHLHTQRRAAGTVQTRVQFDIYAQDREDGQSGLAQAWAIAAAIRAELGHVAARNRRLVRLLRALRRALRLRRGRLLRARARRGCPPLSCARPRLPIPGSRVRPRDGGALHGPKVALEAVRV